jgi:hypothetical protein
LTCCTRPLPTQNQTQNSTPGCTSTVFQFNSPKSRERFSRTSAAMHEVRWHYCRCNGGCKGLVCQMVLGTPGLDAQRVGRMRISNAFPWESTIVHRSARMTCEDMVARVCTSDQVDGVVNAASSPRPPYPSNRAVQKP